MKSLLLTSFVASVAGFIRLASDTNPLRSNTLHSGSRNHDNRRWTEIAAEGAAEGAAVRSGEVYRQAEALDLNV